MNDSEQRRADAWRLALRLWYQSMLGGCIGLAFMACLMALVGKLTMASVVNGLTFGVVWSAFVYLAVLIGCRIRGEL